MSLLNKQYETSEFILVESVNCEKISPLNVVPISLTSASTILRRNCLMVGTYPLNQNNLILVVGIEIDQSNLFIFLGGFGTEEFFCHGIFIYF